MSYKIDDNRVNCYPSTKRASVNKLLTENSITRIINRLIDNDSYVITNGLDGIEYGEDIKVGEWANSQADFEFVIHGYYFSINKGDDLSGLHYLMQQTHFDQLSDNSPHTLYARIFVDKIDKKYPELYGQKDESSTGKYQGLVFYQDYENIVYPDGGSAEDYDVYDAPLVSYMSDDNENSYFFAVPLNALFKFGSQSIKNIDGGEIIL